MRTCQKGEKIASGEDKKRQGKKVCWERGIHPRRKGLAFLPTDLIKRVEHKADIFIDRGLLVWVQYGVAVTLSVANCGGGAIVGSLQVQTGEGTRRKGCGVIEIHISWLKDQYKKR